jgi:hypothetical protein
MKLFSLGNEEKVFIKKEAVEGTLEYPDGNDAVLVTGATGIGQEIEFIDDAQLRDSRSRLSPIKGRTSPGAWSAGTYLKPSGTLGTAPEADVLFECLMGSKLATPGVDVVYSLDSSKNMPSFSMWVKKGHSVFAMAGCTVNQGEFGISGGEIVGVGWSGQFMQWYRGGNALMKADALAAASSIVVDDPTRFSGAGKMKIVIGDEDNAGNGYTITSINYGTGALGISPNLDDAVSTGAIVRGWYPSTSVEVGSPVHGKITTVTIDDIQATLLSASFTIVNNVKYYEDEMNGLWVPTTYGTTGFREVQGSMTLYFRKPTTNYFYKSEYQIQDALKILCGSTAGLKMEAHFPQIEYRTPALSGDEEVMMEIPFVAVASASLDDEVSLTFK